MPIPLLIAGVGAIGSAISAKIQGDQAAAQAEKARSAAAEQTARGHEQAMQIEQKAKGTAESTFQSPEAQRANAAQDLQAQFAQQATGAGGLENQQNVFKQLQAVASGQGPNPAQAMLAQATGANTAQQAALMAGQRGAGANAGLLARQAAMQGAANQQAAAGQGATLQANQSLGALNQLGGIAGQQVGQALQAQQQAAGTALNQLGQRNAANQQAAGLTAQGQMQANDLSAKSNLQAMGITAAAQDKANEGINKAVGNIAGGVGTYLEGLPKKLAEGGEIPEQSGMEAIKKENYSSYKGRSKLGAHLHEYAHGGKIHNMKTGGHVPGKPVVKGPKDDYANDIVDAKLSPGEYVIPRSIAQANDPESKKVMALVKAVMARKGKGK